MAKRQRKFKDRYAGQKSAGPIVISTKDAPEDVETEVLFTIDDVEYTVAKEVPAIIGMRALEIAADEGDAASMSWLMREVLGGKAYEALLACDAVSSKQLAQIMQVVRDKAMGDMEEALGNS